MNIFILALLLTLNVSCSDSSDSAGEVTENFQGISYVGKDTTNLTANETSLSGTGKIGLNQPLGEINSESKIVASFYLEDAGSITFHTYADDNLENGLDIVFTRTGTELEVKMLADGSEVILFDEEHSEDEDHDHEEEHDGLDIDASTVINLKIDVHNSETPAHIAFWQATRGEDVSNENLIFNSADTEEGNHQAPGNGSGTFLGITFNKATLENIAIAEATEEDEIGEAHDHD